MTQAHTVELDMLTVGGGTPEWKRVSVVINSSDFNIDENNLDSQLCALGTLLYKYGQLSANLKAELSRKEDKLKTSYAILAQKERYNSKDVKVTESIIRERVDSNPTYIELQDHLHLVELYSLMADNWWKTIQQKAELVKALCYKQKAEIKTY